VIVGVTRKNVQCGVAERLESVIRQNVKFIRKATVVSVITSAGVTSISADTDYSNLLIIKPSE
jgi:hypothetical protein